MSVSLAQKVRASGQRFDRILIMQRGGAFPGDIVARQLGMNALQVVSASLRSYEPGSMNGSKQLEIGQFPREAELGGYHTLIVDEVCDTGRSLARIKPMVLAYGAATAVTAVLHYKPECSETGFVPDHYIEKTDKWIEYPWEAHDMPSMVATVPDL